MQGGLLAARPDRLSLLVLAYLACCIGFVITSWLSGYYLDYSWLLLFPVLTVVALTALELGFREGYGSYFLMGALVTFQAPFLFFVGFDAIYSTQVLLDKNNCSQGYPSELGTQWCNDLIAKVAKEQIKYAMLVGFGCAGLLITCLFPFVANNDGRMHEIRA